MDACADELGRPSVFQSDGRPVLIDWGQCMELDTTQRRTLCEMTLLLRTRCMPLIGQVSSASEGTNEMNQRINERMDDGSER